MLRWQSGQASKRFAIAKDYHLSGILDHREAATAHFCKKGFPPDKSVDIAHVSADHRTSCGGPRPEEFGKELLWRDGKMSRHTTRNAIARLKFSYRLPKIDPRIPRTKACPDRVPSCRAKLLANAEPMESDRPELRLGLSSP
jgi:hypothetical protein